MNTKTDGISSGLVAVRIDTDGYPLVRLSDAEAIIAAKDAEIERLKREVTVQAYWSQRWEKEYSTVTKQAERIKELESDVDEEAHIRDRMAQLLAETAVAIKGPEKALHRHGWQDLPEVAAKQSAALKMARAAIDLERDFGCCALYVERRDEALAAIDAAMEGK